MGQLEVDASNVCIPHTYISNLISSFPPLPTTTRGEPVILDGQVGRIHKDRPWIVYASGKLVIVRELNFELESTEGPLALSSTLPTDNHYPSSPQRHRPHQQQQQQQQVQDQEPQLGKYIQAFVYRGHNAQVTCAKFSPSGCYVASADIRGKLRVWSYDNQEHLCKLDLSSALAGCIRDIAWDIDSKRICIVGDGSKTDAMSLCSRVIQWDTGVSCGDLGQYARKRAASCAIRPERPMRIVTSGRSEDPRCIFHDGPPFRRMMNPTVAEQAHSRGDVHCVRYNKQGSMIASVGTDKSVCFYHGLTMELIRKMEAVHDATIYSCAWNSQGDTLLTCSADGTVKIIDAREFTVLQTWPVGQNLAMNENQNHGQAHSKVPLGGMQLGCTFVNGDVPVSISLNGLLSILPWKHSVVPTLDKSLSGHRSLISSFAIDRSTNNSIYTGDVDGIICKWDLSSNTSVRVRRHGQKEDDICDCDNDLMNRVHSGAITGMVLIDGYLMSVGWDDRLRFTSGSLSLESIKLPAQPNRIVKGRELLVILTSGGILLAKQGKIISELFVISYQCLCVCVSDDDTTIYVGGSDRAIHIYRVESANQIREVQIQAECHIQPISALMLSHDNSKLASADTRDVCVWSITPDGLVPLVKTGRWCFHRIRINALAWSPDDNMLASAGEDDSIFVWNLEKLTTRIHYPFAHRGGITGIEFLCQSERSMLLSVGGDGCVNIWDLTDDIKKTFG